MAYEKIEYTKTDGVAVIRLNQPDTLNATTLGMVSELVDAFGRAGREARAVMLCAAGRAFCAGASLSGEVFDLADPERDAGISLEKAMNPLIVQLRDLPVPFVTAVKGAAAGVGCSMALMGDLIVAGESAYFLQAFRHVGLVPDGGSAYLLSRAVGRVRAMEMMLLGARFPARAAFEAGLVTRLVPDDTLEETAMTLARDLAAGPTVALGLIRRSAWAALDSTLPEQLARERAFQREVGRTADFVEGVTAFNEKRPPAFRGR